MTKTVQAVVLLIFSMKQRMHGDFAWAGLCLMGAVYFVFRSK